MAVRTLGGAQLWADRRWRAGWRIQRNVLNEHHRLLDAKDNRHASGTLERCIDALDAKTLPAAPSHVVLVLHGLGRSRRSMAGMAQALQGEGLHPVLVDYPSTRRRLEDHVDQIVDLLAHIEGAERVSFVTHSLGGIVARGVLAHPDLSLRPDRLVMCAPPSRGTAFARVLNVKAPTFFGAFMGPTGRQLAEGVDVPVPSIPFIVIAGGRGPKGLNPLIEGDDDGIVGVEETKLPGMRDHLVVPSIHTFVMDHPEAQKAAKAFLKED